MAPFPAIPSIHPQIIDAIERERFMIFIGAGVSRILGCWGWKDMCLNLVCSCRREDIIDDKLKHSFIEIINNGRARESLTRCYKILDKIGRLDVYENIIRLACQGDITKIREVNVYDEILRIPAVFITTNFDDILANKFLIDRVKYKEGDFNLEIDRETLYQVHGSKKNFNTIIVTDDDYALKYTDHEYITFLKHIFSEYLILFIGYGLNEMEINLQRYESILKNSYYSFLLKPYRDNNIHLYDNDLLYYSSKKVSILPYYIGHDNYGLLYYVLRQWNYEIRNKTSKILEDMKEIDRLMNHE